MLSCSSFISSPQYFFNVILTLSSFVRTFPSLSLLTITCSHPGSLSSQYMVFYPSWVFTLSLIVNFDNKMPSSRVFLDSFDIMQGYTQRKRFNKQFSRLPLFFFFNWIMLFLFQSNDCLFYLYQDVLGPHTGCSRQTAVKYQLNTQYQYQTFYLLCLSKQNKRMDHTWNIILFRQMSKYFWASENGGTFLKHASVPKWQTAYFWEIS